ncbi:unnamed protein product, partial [marine sediment metagenome]
MTNQELENPEIIPANSAIVAIDNLSSMGVAREAQPFEYVGKTYFPSSNSHWKVMYPTGMKSLSYCNRLYPIGNSL